MRMKVIFWTGSIANKLERYDTREGTYPASYSPARFGDLVTERYTFDTVQIIGNMRFVYLFHKKLRLGIERVRFDR